MKFSSKFPDPIGFQLAPMLDVVFLLLVFFVMTQRFILNEQDLKVKVPTAPKTTEETARAINEIIVNVREQDEELIITIDRNLFTRDQLAQMLRRMVEMDPNQPVRIRADAETRWQKVADVISTCTLAGVYNLSFSKQMPGNQNNGL